MWHCTCTKNREEEEEDVERAHKACTLHTISKHKKDDTMTSLLHIIGSPCILAAILRFDHSRTCFPKIAF